MKKISILAIAALLATALTAAHFSTFNTTTIRPIPELDKPPVEIEEADIVVYGGSSVGVVAAVAAGRMGHKVILVESSYRIGGLTSGGLTKTDIGKPRTIGGISREFYNRVLDYYTKTYGKDSRQVKDCDGGYFFEPKVAMEIYYQMLKEAGVRVFIKERMKFAELANGRIASFITENYETGQLSRFRGKVYVDGSYEGDLMAQAGVLYRVGREARSEYNEPLAGITAGPEEYVGKGDQRVQAYNMRSTLTTNPEVRIPFPRPKNYYRSAHKHFIDEIKAHNITSIEQLFPDHHRWAMINGKCDPNKADFPAVNYTYADGDYETRARITAQVQDYWLSLWYMLQNDPEVPAEFRKNAQNWGLPKDEYLESNHISPQVYVRVARRMLGRYFLTQYDILYDRYKPDTVCMGSYNMDSHTIQHIAMDGGKIIDEGFLIASAGEYEIPYRSMLPYGLDNLIVSGAVSASHIAYSSLRMEPVFMMLGEAGGTAAAIAHETQKAAQNIDTKELQKRLTQSGIPLKAPFRPVVEIELVDPDQRLAVGKPIAFKLKEKYIEDPLATIAWNFDGSGEVQATGKTATWTFNQATPQTVTVLVTDKKKRWALPARLTLNLGDAPTLNREIQYEKAKLTGRWERIRGSEVEYRERVGLIDGVDPVTAKAEFTTTLPQTGRYKVAIAYPTAGKRGAEKVHATLAHADGTANLVLNQYKKTDQNGKPTPYAFTPVGEYRFNAGQPATVTITNENAEPAPGGKPRVTIDAVRWIWLGE